MNIDLKKLRSLLRVLSDGDVAEFEYEDKQIRLVFDLDEKEVFDYLPEDLQFRPTRMNDGWFEKLRRFYPGYCWQWVDSVKVETNGDIYPCCIATNGDLKLGNIRHQDLEESRFPPLEQYLVGN